MTIHEALEQEVGNLSVKTRFEFADLNEANATIFDKLTSGEFPVCLVLPFDIVDDKREGISVYSTAEINTIFLDRIPQITTDLPTSQVENDAIAPMRALTRELVNRLDRLDMMDENGIESLTNRSTHQALMDAHLYGNWGVFTVRFTEDLTTCLC